MKILLIEDNEELAESLADVFRDEGHEVIVAFDGASALRAAEGGFDLAMIDVRLPDGPGTALLPKLKRASPTAEVIITTGNADLESAIEAVKGGAFSYLTKPVSVDELLVTVSRALERVQLRQHTRELRQALEESERRHRDIIEGVQAMIIALDRDLRIQFANPAVESITGWKREELLGREHFETFSPPAERESRRVLARQAFQGRISDYEVNFLCRDGSVRRVQMRWSRQQGNQDLIYGMGLDVTRQRQLERKARVSEKLAAVGTLAAGLAHEIRNPLNAAGLQLALLSRRIGKLSPDERPPLEGPLGLVRTELSRLDGLLADFLAFARPRDYARFPVDLGALVRGVVDLEQVAAQEAGRRLDVETAGQVVVAGDADALQQVLVNLIHNAIEAARATVRVRTARKAGRALITVEDDGPGLPAEILSRAFEPFFTTKPKGTGLGLAIVHTIVTSHGGEVTLETGSSGGALARVTLPLFEGTAG
jgi:PAS domain S-box-containing protein